MALSSAIRYPGDGGLARFAAALMRGGWWASDADAKPAPDVIPVEAISDLVTWHDTFGNVVKVGADAGRMFDVDAAALHGGGYLARIHVTDRPVFLKALSDAAHGRAPVQVEFRVHAGADGERDAFRSLVRDQTDAGPQTLWVEMRAHRLEAETRTKSGSAVIAFTRDITLRKHHAEELEKARREAERANELKGRFLATVSHELRTPLNAIIGFSELLGVDHPFLLTEERRKEYALIIRGSGTHLLDIVNTLLDMSKIESGNFNFQPEPFRLPDLVDSCCDLMKLKADEAMVVVERRVDHDLPDFSGDRRACRQILINLLSNALKFTKGGGQVRVSLASHPDGYALSVADTGVGIPEADLPRLGDPFFQAGDIHRRSHDGTGLGLSVVRGLVGLHGGRLVIESGVGQGTTVTVLLPTEASADRAVGGPVPVQTYVRAPARQPERRSA